MVLKYFKETLDSTVEDIVEGFKVINRHKKDIMIITTITGFVFGVLPQFVRYTTNSDGPYFSVSKDYPEILEKTNKRINEYSSRSPKVSKIKIMGKEIKYCIPPYVGGR